ncbi:DUF3168 domain-containing protein [Herbidospora mongoliensis]|uniref:DUF3168 domain-containing protein n=1 Tax=Herbidospora mongoliensis TaxID=688067 RepID=UPI00082D8E40|nr:DUF3168 domain-containing protein [Herbidospora mongoliensis]
MSALWPVQQAIFSHVNPTVQAATTEPLAEVTGLYDEPPERAEVPYLAFGELTEKAMGTHGSQEYEVIVTINAWSGYKGNRQASLMIAAVVDLLHRQRFPIEGWELVSIAHLADGVRKTSGNQTPNIRQAQARFRVWVTRPVGP